MLTIILDQVTGGKERNRRGNDEEDATGEFDRALQQLRRQSSPDPVWMIHQPGNILDDTWSPKPSIVGEYASVKI